MRFTSLFASIALENINWIP